MVEALLSLLYPVDWVCAAFPLLCLFPHFMPLLRSKQGFVVGLPSTLENIANASALLAESPSPLVMCHVVGGHNDDEENSSDAGPGDAATGMSVDSKQFRCLWPPAFVNSLGVAVSQCFGGEGEQRLDVAALRMVFLSTTKFVFVDVMRRFIPGSVREQSPRPGTTSKSTAARAQDGSDGGYGREGDGAVDTAEIHGQYTDRQHHGHTPDRGFLFKGLDEFSQAQLVAEADDGDDEWAAFRHYFTDCNLYRTFLTRRRRERKLASRLVDLGLTTEAADDNSTLSLLSLLDNVRDSFFGSPIVLHVCGVVWSVLCR